MRLTRPLSISHNEQVMIDRVNIVPIGLVYRGDIPAVKSHQ